MTGLVYISIFRTLKPNTENRLTSKPDLKPNRSTFEYQDLSF